MRPMSNNLGQRLWEPLLLSRADGELLSTFRYLHQQCSGLSLRFLHLNTLIQRTKNFVRFYPFFYFYIEMPTIMIP